MRSILSIPEQIKKYVINGSLKDALFHAKLAYSNNYSDLLSEYTTIFSIANVLSDLSIKGKINTVQEKVLVDLIFIKESNLLASLKIISYFISNPNITPIIPPKEVLEILSVLAIDSDSLSDEELIKASYALANNI
jgi:hypothetical protein